jgi:predicted RNase H-like HicB family nuclease
MEETNITSSVIIDNSLKAIVHSDPDGGYWAEVPAMRSCYTQADTLDELVQNLQEAVTGWLEADAIRRHTTPSLSSDSPRVRVMELAA